MAVTYYMTVTVVLKALQEIDIKKMPDVTN